MSSRGSASAMAVGLPPSNENEVELMRTILGEHVPQSVILTCLNACGFDVSAALNWYFMDVASHAEAGPTAEQDGRDGRRYVPWIESGLSLTLHARHVAGMVSKTDAYYATLTRGIASYDMLTPSNHKFLTIRLRKRAWRTGDMLAPQKPFFANGDVVTLECNGLWLKASQLNKVLQWKAPSEDDRNKFVIRGLPLGRNLRPGDYFFLTSYRWKDKEIVLRDERPVGMSSFNMSAHRGFLGLERIKSPSQRFFMYAKLTENALETLAQPTDPLDMTNVNISVMGSASAAPEQRPSASPQQTRQSSRLSDELTLMDTKLDQMAAIIGNEVSRDRLVYFLDGAGGNVQVALEHYFMTISTMEPEALPDGIPPSSGRPPLSSVAHVNPTSMRERTIRRPQSEMIIPIPMDPVPSDPNTPDSSSGFSSLDYEHSHLPPAPTPREHAAAAREMARERVASAPEEPFAVEDESCHQDQESLTIQDFEMLSVLGKGSFGAVMLVRFKKDGRVFALKIIKKTNMDRADVVNAMEERQILQRIHHPYICGLVFAFQTNERLYLGMKYYAAGDLFYHLNLKGKLDLVDARLYGAELVLAISYLHELNILYRDLKPSNVMIDAEGHIGVVDFGLSKQHIYGSSYGVNTLSGTAEYVAPEALAQKADGSRNYGKAYDWWSLGIVLYEMIVGESPFYHENEHQMLTKIAYADVIFPHDFPKEALDLVRGLLHKDPSRRLGSDTMGGVDAIKANVFFRSIDWNKLHRREVKAHWTPKLTSETDTRYVDPEFIDEGPPSAAYDPSAMLKKAFSKRFSQFSFNYNLK